MSVKPPQPDVDADVVDVGHYARVLRSSKRLLALGLVLGLLGGVLAALLRTPAYTAEAEVVVRQVGAGDSVSGLNSDGGVNIETQQQIASSAAVGAVVADRLGIPADRPVQSGLTVTVPNKSSVLHFAYTADDPQVAQERAQAFAEAYLEVREDQARQAVDAAVAAVEERMASVQEDLAQVREDVQATDADTPAGQDARVRQEVLLQQMVSLQSRLGQLATLALDPGAVIQSAGRPGPESVAVPVFLVIGGGLLGLLVAMVLAVLLDRADSRVRTGADVERSARLPVLATLGRRRAGGSGGGPDVAAQVLAARLLVAARREDHRVVMVSSPSTAEDPAGVAAALVSALQRMGNRAALVTVSTDGGDTDASRRSIAAARESAELVVVATPPVLRAADALLVAAEVDAVVLVARTASTRTAELVEAARDLDDVDARVLGVVLVPAEGLSAGTGAPGQRTATGATASERTQPLPTR